jgi:hypothetical protein
MSPRRGVLGITSGELGSNWDRSEVSGGFVEGSGRAERAPRWLAWGARRDGGDRSGTGGARRGSDATGEVGSGTDGWIGEKEQARVGSWVDGLGSNRLCARLVPAWYVVTKATCGPFQVQ